MVLLALSHVCQVLVQRLVGTQHRCARSSRRGTIFLGSCSAFACLEPPPPEAARAALLRRSIETRDNGAWPRSYAQWLARLAGALAGAAARRGRRVGNPQQAALAAATQHFASASRRGSNKSATFALFQRQTHHQAAEIATTSFFAFVQHKAAYIQTARCGGARKKDQNRSLLARGRGRSH